MHCKKDLEKSNQKTRDSRIKIENIWKEDVRTKELKDLENPGHSDQPIQLS